MPDAALPSLCRPANYAERASFPQDPRLSTIDWFGIVFRCASTFNCGGDDMITEDYLRTSHRFRRLKNGPHGQIVELYAAHLVKDEFSGASTRRHLKSVSDLFSWLKRCGLKQTDLDEYMIERYLKYRAGKR